jgi:hypothetical protein
MRLDGATIAVWLVFLATALPIALVVLTVIAASNYVDEDTKNNIKRLKDEDAPYKVEPLENKKEKD